MKYILGINVVSGLEVIVSKIFNNTTKVISVVLLWLVAQPIFLVYDYAMTMIITFYMERIHKKI